MKNLIILMAAMAMGAMLQVQGRTADSLDTGHHIVVYNYHCNTTTASGAAAVDSFRLAVVKGERITYCGEYYWTMLEMVKEQDDDIMLGEFESRCRTGYELAHSSIYNLQHKATLSLVPASIFTMGATLRHNQQSSSAGSRQAFALLDCHAQVKMKRCVLRVTIENLLGTRHYIHTVASGPYQYINDYTLCGRTIMATVVLLTV